MKLNDDRGSNMDDVTAYEEILTQAELDELEKEFRPRLGNACYLDHSGATLYAKSQIDGFHAQLATTLFSNPHSRNPSSSITSDAIDYVRDRILQHFGTTSDEYSVIFTSGATSAVKLLGESFAFNGGTFAYFEESHTSIVGMREIVGRCYCNGNKESAYDVHPPNSTRIKINEKKIQRADEATQDKGEEEDGEKNGGGDDGESGKKMENPCGEAKKTKVYCIAKESLEKLMGSDCKNCNRNPREEDAGADTIMSAPLRKRQNGLLAYPAQCNFSGYKYPLEWIKKIHHGHLECINGLNEFYVAPEMIVGESTGVSSESWRNEKTSEPPETQNNVIHARNTYDCGQEKAKEKVGDDCVETKLRIPGGGASLQAGERKESKSCEEITRNETKGSEGVKTKVEELSSIKNEYDAEIKLKTGRGDWNSTEGIPASPASSPPSSHSGTTIKENHEEEEGKRKQGDGESNSGAHQPPLQWETRNRNGKGNTVFENHYPGLLDEDVGGGGGGNGGDGGRVTKDEDQLQWFVLLDAASFVSTNALDLGKHLADFVAVSFYKMFGFPTGLGALIVRRNAGHLLEKDYFGGGTVNIAIPSTKFHAKRLQLHERFEDGTISFLSILALRHGFEALNKLGRGMDTISERCFRLGRYFYNNLVIMKYANGEDVARIYSDTKYETRETQGPVVTFNLLRPDGNVIGYSEMEQMAYLQDVHLRYGCFCNVGACRRHLKLQPDELLKHYEAGHVCGDMMDLMDGKPTGAIRVSFGYMTSQKDVDLLLGLIHNSWVRPFLTQNLVSTRPERSSTPSIRNDETVLGTYSGHDEDKAEEVMVERKKEKKRKLSRIFVYPVKSCAGFQVSKMWAIGSRGLFYDREWLILNSSGVPLTQKREPRLCQLKPNIDISNRRLVLSMEGFPDAHVPLDVRQMQETLNLGGQSFTKADLCTSKLHSCTSATLGLNAQTITAGADIIVNQNISHTSSSLKTREPIGSYNCEDVGPKLFVGRDNDLKQAQDFLEQVPADNSTNTISFNTVVIHGMAGVGKTTLVRHLVKKVSVGFENVIWIPAQTKESLSTVFIDLGINKFNLVVRKDSSTGQVNLKAIVDAVYFQLLRYRTLLVFDNAEFYETQLNSGTNQEIGQGIAQFLPKLITPPLKYPKILITSRIADWNMLTHNIVPLQLLEKDVCLQYIKNRLGHIKDVEENSEKLANYFGYLTIAIESAVDAILFWFDLNQGYGHFKIESFFEKLQVKRHDYCSEYGNVVEITYDRLKTLWNSTFKMLEAHQHGPTALRILDTLSFMSPSGVPWKLLDQVCQLIPRERRLLAINVLKSLSLAITTDKSVVIHRLIQETRIKLLAKSPTISDQLIEFCESYRKTLDCLTYLEPDYYSFVSNALAVQLKLKSQVNFEACQTLFFDIAVILEGFYPEFSLTALRFLNAHLIKSGLTNTCERRIKVLNKLMEALISGAKYKQAECLARKAHALRKLGLGENNEGTLSALHLLGYAFEKQGELKSALKVYNELDKIRSTTLKDNEEAFLKMKIRIGKIIQQGGRSGFVVKTFKEIYRIQRKKLGEDHGDTLETHLELARGFVCQGKYNCAIRAYEDIYRIQCRKVGAEHPASLETKCEMAHAMLLQGVYTAASDVLNQVYDAQTQIFGDKHPVSMSTKDIIGYAYQLQGNYKESLKIHGQVYSIMPDLHFNTCVKLV